MDVGTKRVFLAIALPKSLASELLVWVPEGVRPESWPWHITLRFWPALNPASLKALDEALSAIKAPALEIEICGLGFFKGFKGGPLWAGVKATPELVNLAQKINSLKEPQDSSFSSLKDSGQVLGQGGFSQKSASKAKARPFRPHITLARLKKEPEEALKELVAAKASDPLGSFTAKSLSLWESRLDPRGAIRTLIREYPFVNL
ncbi:MAG: 2'-5' RNA ligase family protein [Deltaproteobacteria bacterium]|jgi:2'-5' RNA ligase|nr:2'-5' RNA ligase family protein [Deltaproteobacteria bacterium]